MESVRHKFKESLYKKINKNIVIFKDNACSGCRDILVQFLQNKNINQTNHKIVIFVGNMINYQPLTMMPM